MNVSAVICEYNPFHNGHKYQIDTARAITGCDAVVALMSGNFVQRGDFAFFDKAVRADAALSNGADLILENPALSTLRSAEGYASAAVYTLTALGCVDTLFFGAECENLPLLTSIAELLAFEGKDFKNGLSCELSKGASFPSARGASVSRILGTEAGEALKKPNNLLAIEYIKALIRQKSPIKPLLIKRTGAEHNSNDACGCIASASYIRDALSQNDVSAFDFVPEEARNLYQNSNHFISGSVDKGILSALAILGRDEIASAPDISEGLHNKIKKECMKHSTLDALVDAVKSKRYAHSRIRRSLLCAYLKITADDVLKMPEYIKVLAFNKQGQAVLNMAKKTASLPVTTNASPLMSMPSAMRMWQRELEFDRVYEIFAMR